MAKVWRCICIWFIIIVLITLILFLLLNFILYFLFWVQSYGEIPNPTIPPARHFAYQTFGIP